MPISDWIADVFSADLQAAGAGDAGTAHAARDDRGVAGHPAARGEDAPCLVHAVDVLRAGLGADEDDRLDPSRRLFGAVGVEHDLARSGPGAGRTTLSKEERRGGQGVDMPVKNR